MNIDLNFWRLNGNSNRYKNEIQVPGLNERLGTLYDDIFGSHTRTKFSKYQREFEVIDNETRYISEDSINTHFFHDYYIPPRKINVTNTPSLTSISYGKFYRRLTDNFDSNHSTPGFFGSNLVSFLTGSIGDGKTSLVSKVIYDISENDELIIPIYISIEEDWTETDRDGNKKPKKLDESFYQFLIKKVENVISKDQRLSDFCDDVACLNAESELSKLLESIRADGFQVLLIFDDLDRYHFYHDKHTLFDYDNKCLKSLDAIVDLHKKFSRFDLTKPLSCLGISVVFVLRNYVYASIHEKEGLNPRGGNNFCYEIEKPSYTTVVTQRLSMLIDVIDQVDTETEFWKDVKENVLGVRVAIDSIADRSVLEFTRSNNLEKIFLFSHHGCRSVIDFMKGLRIFSHNQRNVMNRYLSEDHSAIVILYLLNHKYLYSQNNNHFPNLYLVNAHITTNYESKELYPEAYEAHRQTYWLKLLILQYLKHQSTSQCSVGNLLTVFTELGSFEPGLVKLAIGSLATPNWFACIKFEYESSNININNRKISLTNRGNFLLEKNEHGLEFCFSFIYLQLIVDDYLLHFPNLVEEFYIKHDYSYLYEKEGAYGQGIGEIVKEKYPRVIQFIRVLECSFDNEKKLSSNMFDYFEKVKIPLPNFEKIYEETENQVTALLGSERAKELLGNTSLEVKKVRDSDSLCKFFSEVYFGEQPAIVSS